MNKSFLTAVVLILVLSLAGCAGSNAPGTTPETTGRVPEETTVETTTEAPAESSPEPTEIQAPSDKKLTAEEAKVIALNHAKVKEADVRDLDIDLDTENGKQVYEISFEAKNYEYDYHIDAYTGNILRSEKEPEEDVPAVQTDPTPTETEPKPEKVVSTDTKEKISADKAKSIAFNHAKVKDADVRDLDVELDNENGTLVYEISFEAGDYDYEYDIDAFTGKVIRHEKERND